MKQNKKNNSNAQENDALSQFWSIFDHRFNFITAPNPYINPRTGQLRKTKRGKLKPDWRMERDFAIRSRVLEATFFNPEELVGLGFDNKTNKITLDIDHLSQYDPLVNQENFNAVLGSLEAIGLCRPVYERSSITNGLHVWYFLDEKINTFNLACAVQETLKDNDFKIASGQLEIFPNTKSFKQNRKDSFYKAIKLPLQPLTGSYLLNDDFEPDANTIESFISRAEWSKAGNDTETLKKASKKYGRRVRLQRCGRSKKSLKKFEQDLLKAINRAFTSRGQTNDLLLDIGTYGVIFLRLDTPEQLEELKDWIRNTITDLDGYEQYCGHQRDIEQRCMEVAKSSQDFYWAAGKPRKRDRKTFKDNYDNVLNYVQDGREAEKIKATQKMEKAIEGILEQIHQGLIAIPRNLTAYRNLIIAESRKLFSQGLSTRTLNKTYNKTVWQTAFAALAAIQIASSEPVEAVAIANVTLEAAPIVEVLEQPLEAIDLAPAASKKIKTESQTLKNTPDPVARAEQSKTNLEKKLDVRSISAKVNIANSNAPVLTSETAQNEPQDIVLKLTQTDSSKSPQSQSQTGGLQCEQKSEDNKSLDPAETLISLQLSLYEGFGGASRLSIFDLPDVDLSSPASLLAEQTYCELLLTCHLGSNALEQAEWHPGCKVAWHGIGVSVWAILEPAKARISSGVQSPRLPEVASPQLAIFVDVESDGEATAAFQKPT